LATQPPLMPEPITRESNAGVIGPRVDAVGSIKRQRTDPISKLKCRGEPLRSLKPIPQKSSHTGVQAEAVPNSSLSHCVSVS
jgi:hypothetical protein